MEWNLDLDRIPSWFFQYVKCQSPQILPTVFKCFSGELYVIVISKLNIKLKVLLQSSFCQITGTCNYRTIAVRWYTSSLNIYILACIFCLGWMRIVIRPVMISSMNWYIPSSTSLSYLASCMFRFISSKNSSWVFSSDGLNNKPCLWLIGKLVYIDSY